MNTEKENKPKPEGQKNKKGTMRFENFLESIPLYIEKHVSGFHKVDMNYRLAKASVSYSQLPEPHYELTNPSIQLFCSCRLCNGIRWFEVVDYDLASNDIWGLLRFIYKCRNCKQEQKIYTILAEKVSDDDIAKVQKIGEFPQLRPRVSNQVISLIEPDKELFDKGLLSESKGLGIGAFTYYRRVVYNQWRILLDKIKEATKKQEESDEVIHRIEEAEKEEQFGKAVDIVKDIIPETLRIRGHNPISLLYSETSVAIHELTDEECLKMADTIRFILSKLAENIYKVNKDAEETKAHLTRIFGKKKNSEKDKQANDTNDTKTGNQAPKNNNN